MLTMYLSSMECVISSGGVNVALQGKGDSIRLIKMEKTTYFGK